MDFAKRQRQYLFTIVITIRHILSQISKLKNAPIFVRVADLLLSLYYYYCGLSPCTVDLDDETTMHFWISRYRRHDRPNLVMIHGCGGDARWQFFLQVRSLSECFNIYMPDLLFFGKSYTKCTNRTPNFQAKCVMRGLKRGFGVKRCSVYSISYGSWVGYWMAEMYPKEVERNVIVSTGIAHPDDQKWDELMKVGRPVQEIAVARDPDALRYLSNRSVLKFDTSWVPDFFLWEFIRLKEDKTRKQKEELIECLISGEADDQLPTLSQETLLVWGDEDKVFPTYLAYQLKRHLGPKARLEMLKGAGHGVNIDSPRELNELIKSFVLKKSAV